MENPLNRIPESPPPIDVEAVEAAPDPSSEVIETRPVERVPGTSSSDEERLRELREELGISQKRHTPKGASAPQAEKIAGTEKAGDFYFATLEYMDGQIKMRPAHEVINRVMTNEDVGKIRKIMAEQSQQKRQELEERFAAAMDTYAKKGAAEGEQDRLKNGVTEADRIKILEIMFGTAPTTY